MNGFTYRLLALLHVQRSVQYARVRRREGRAVRFFFIGMRVCWLAELAK